MNLDNINYVCDAEKDPLKINQDILDLEFAKVFYKYLNSTTKQDLSNNKPIL